MSGLPKKLRRELGKAKADAEARAMAWSLRDRFEADDKKFHAAIERSRAHDEAALRAVKGMGNG